ncbi:DUF1566 domain-containing protein [Bdellovibrio sp. HCB2-146]|uniref:Lcl domain-containing protein n=1 Tax=Bdellovibrio sp. HCB2-146 TaxID=3394362 RepID=UPI0039BCE680
MRFIWVLFVILFCHLHANAFISLRVVRAKRVLTGCYANSLVIGQTCADGTIYIGRDSMNRKLVTPPGNCTHEPGGTHMTTPTSPFTPTCSGTTDNNVAKAWGANTITTGFNSPNDGRANTIGAATGYSDTRATRYCYFMRYGGYDDWYLPARNELNLFWTNRSLLSMNPAVGILTSGQYYFSSTEYSSTHAYVQRFSDGTQISGGNKDTSGNGNAIRCIRRHP